MDAIHFLDDYLPVFPETRCALEEPNGLLAIGGNLLPETILDAYGKGIFPWFSDDQPILWWSPSPRMALLPSNLHISRSLQKFARKKAFHITVDTAFSEVMQACGDISRPDQDGTWINPDMLEAYTELHQQGHAHSIEAWLDGNLVGGLYGLAMGKVFFGESMFSRVSNASKIAFVSLVKQLQTWHFELIDCQIHTDYLASFGATELNRDEFENILHKAIDTQNSSFSWQENWQLGKYGFDGEPRDISQ